MVVDYDTPLMFHERRLVNIEEEFERTKAEGMSSKLTSSRGPQFTQPMESVSNFNKGVKECMVYITICRARDLGIPRQDVRVSGPVQQDVDIIRVNALNISRQTSEPG